MFARSTGCVWVRRTRFCSYYFPNIRGQEGMRRSFATSANYYKELGVSQGSSQEEIKKAFRKLARVHHPDLHDGDKEHEIKFKKIAEAYEVLSNTSKKEAYDRETLYSHRKSEYSSHFTSDEVEYADVEDIFSQFGFGTFGSNYSTKEFDEFYEFRGQRRKTKTKTKKKRKVNGSKVSASVTISFTEAVKGTKRDLVYSADVSCDPCSGSGTASGKAPTMCKSCNGSGTKSILKKSFIMQIQCTSCKGTGETIVKPCNNCGGTGKTRKRQSVTVDIPRGIDSGQSVRIKGKGNIGLHGGSTGDLIVEISILSHPIFKREGPDIHATQTLSIDQAIFGATLEVPTLDGPNTIYVRSGTTHGERSTLYGKGVGNTLIGKESRGPGNHIITWNINIPNSRDLTDRQRTLLEEFAREENQKNKTKA